MNTNQFNSPIFADLTDEMQNAIKGGSGTVKFFNENNISSPSLDVDMIIELDPTN